MRSGKGEMVVSEAVPAQSKASRDTQLSLNLFEQIGDGERDYSNSFELYDLAPKYVQARGGGRQVDEKGLPAQGSARYLPVSNREFRFGTRVYDLEIRPARIKKGRGKDAVEYELYPGVREQFVEEALRRIAIEKKRTMLIRQGEMTYAGLTFSFYELRQKLQELGHSYPLDEIKEALEVCHMANIRITDGVDDGDALVSSTIFPVMAMNKAQPNGQRMCVVAFNPLVSDAIMKVDYRLMNLNVFAKLRSIPARWLYRRMVHRFTQADLLNSFNINASTVMADSGMGRYKQHRDAIYAVREVMKDLQANKVITSYTEVPHYQGRKLVDITFDLKPSLQFVSDMKKANHRFNELQNAFREGCPDLQVIEGGRRS